MKKIISFVACVAAIALCVTSCKKKVEPEAPAAFKITVESITYTEASVKIEPLDTNATYYWYVFKADAIEGITNDSLNALIVEDLDFTIWLASIWDYEWTYDSILSKGVDSYEYEGLSPNTKYVALAVNVNSEGIADFESLVKKEFKTQEVVVKNTVDLDFHAAVLDDYRDDDGSFQITAAPADSALVVYLNPYSETLDGNFLYSDLDPAYSGVVDYEEQEVYDLADAQFSGSVSGNIATYSGWFVATNEVKYNFSFSCDVSGLANAPKKAPAAKSASAKKAPAMKLQKQEQMKKNFLFRRK